MFAEFGVESRGQRTFVTGGDVGFDVSEFAHAGNDGRDVVIVEDEAQGHLGHGGTGGNERFEGLGVLDTGAQIFRNEIGSAPIVGGPGGFER